jgi:hypothetical protein
MTISEFVAALNAKFTTPADPTPFEADKRFVKYCRIVHRVSGSRSVFCFI